MNKMQVRSMMKKSWWSYALLLAGVFLFTEGCSLLYGSNKFSIQISIILFSMIMHGSSLSDISKSVLLKKNNVQKSNVEKTQLIKQKSCMIANIITQLILIMIAVLCYFTKLNFFKIILLDIIAIITYCIVSVVSYKFYQKTV